MRLLKCAVLLAAVWALDPLAGQESPETPTPASSKADSKERVKAARALKDGNADSIALLQPMLSDPDRSVRLEAVRSLVAIGTPQSLEPLIAATRDNDPEVQIRATDGLVNFYVPGYVQTGVARFGAAVRGRFDRENRDVVDPWVTVRPEVVTAIGQLVRGGGSMESRANAARAAGILRGRPAVPELVAAMQTKDTQVIYEVLIAFQKIGDLSAGTKAMTFIRDMESRIQLAAIETVGLLKTRESIPDLRRVFDDKKASMAARRAALVALAMLPDPESRPYFDRGFTEKDDRIRAAAAEGYARLNDPSDVAKLQPAFEEETKMPARLGIAFALVALGQRAIEEFSPLTYLVHTLNSRQYRGVAEPYLLELCRVPEVRLAVYKFVAQSTKDEKLGLARILSLTGDYEAVAQVEWISKDSDPEVAAEGLKALRALRTRLN
jgi:HEAT repeat protein